MKLFILLIIASIGCSSSTSTTKQVEELRSLKVKYETLVAEIDTKGKSLDREILKEKQKEVIVLESKMKEIEQQIDDVVIDLTYNKDFKKNNDTYNLRIKSVKQLDKNLEVEIYYPGGCGDPHQFEIITNGKMNAEGVVDFYIIDKNKNDNCKMLMMRTKYFNISKIDKNSKITGFRVNNSTPFNFSRSN